MTSPLFDPRARRQRQERADALRNPFLLERAFDNAVEALRSIARPVERLLLVAPPAIAARSQELPGHVTAVDADGLSTVEPGTFDAAMTVGLLDTLDELPLALTVLRHALKPDSPLVGSLIGGDSFVQLRRALLDADRAASGAAPRAHPRLDASTLAGLLGAAGFAMPVVEVDRLAVRYRSLNQLVSDLRGAALTNQLVARPRSGPGKAWAERLSSSFASAAEDGRVAERIDYLNFLGWSGR